MSDGKRRILLVDDESHILKTLGKHLELAGFDLTVAVDGKDALAKMDTEQIHLVILDLMLPKRSGLEVCSTLRQHARYEHIPIILYSAIPTTAPVSGPRNSGLDSE